MPSTFKSEKVKKLILGAALLFFAPVLTRAQLLPQQDEQMLNQMSQQVHQYYCDSAHRARMQSIPVGNGVQIILYDYDDSGKRKHSGSILFIRAGNSWVSGETEAEQAALLKKIRIRARKACF